MTRRENLATTWIGYENAYDMFHKVSQIFKISHEVINFVGKTMKTRFGLTAGVRSIPKANMKRGLFKEMLYHPYYS